MKKKIELSVCKHCGSDMGCSHRKEKSLRCCVTTCNKEATNLLGNNLLKGSIPFCHDCLKLFEEHSIAREQHFKEYGQEEALEKTEKMIRELSKGNVITISQSFKIIKQLKKLGETK